jgi:beta-lactamase class D
MIKPLFALPIMALMACGGDWFGATTGSSPVTEYRADWARLLADSGVAGVFVLWEPNSFRLESSDTVRDHRGFLPASTFKVFNSLVALQTAAVVDEHTIIPWDSTVRRPEWDVDMDMATAIERSCVPWYQEVARRAGALRMQHWLDTVHYGNATMGDPIHLFWLQGELRITPMQQVYFMQKLNEERLPFEVKHQRTVKRILPGDSTATWRIRGKTGWAVRMQEEYGWYVGWVERAGRTAYFAINIDIRSMDDVPRRQTLTRLLLMKEGLLDPDAL